MNPPELNRVSIWQPIPSEDLDIKVFTGYHHKQNGVVLATREPVYRYAKNFTVNGKGFSLLMVSPENDSNAVSEFLSTVAADINDDQATGNLTALEAVYGE